MSISQSKYLFFTTLLPLLTCVACSKNAASPTAAPLAGGAAFEKSFAPGSTLQYSGSETVQVTYTAPSATKLNFSASYNTSEVDTVQVAPPGSPAAIDVHKVITYSANEAPLDGIQLAMHTVDQYENIVPANNPPAQYNVVLVQKVVSQSGTNISAEVEEPSGAPYAFSSMTTVNFAAPTQVLSLPLIRGETWGASLARTVGAQASTVNSSGASYSASNLTTQYQDDGSYSESGQINLVSSTNRTLLSDGSGVITNTNSATSAVSLLEEIGAPIALDGQFVIPVSIAKSATGVPSSYSAIDWYPGRQGLGAPLSSQSYKVIGPISALPPGCTYSGPQPNLNEYDISSQDIDPVKGSYSVGSTRIFDSNGTTVCSLSTSTVATYEIKTGLLVKTRVTTSASSLNN